MKPKQSFFHLECPNNDQNQWWKYILVIIIGLVGGQFIGAIPLIFVMIFQMAKNGTPMIPSENAADFSVYGIGQNLGLLLMIIPFIASLVLAVILIKSFHKRSFTEVINGRKKLRWNHLFSGFIFWGIITLPFFFFDLVFNPENLVFQLKWSSFIPLVFIAILFIPFQAGTEEFFMRGYLAQGIGSGTKSRWFALFIPSVLFALMHVFNPEVKEFGFWITMPQYLLFGLMFGLVSILDDGIEIAIGAHSANNILSAILVTHKSSALQTPAMFIQNEINPKQELWILLICCIIFISLLKYILKWDFSVLNQKVEKNDNEFPEQME